jgi:hypothetical protein
LCAVPQSIMVTQPLCWKQRGYLPSRTYLAQPTSL